MVLPTTKQLNQFPHPSFIPNLAQLMSRDPDLARRIADQYFFAGDTRAAHDWRSIAEEAQFLYDTKTKKEGL